MKTVLEEGFIGVDMPPLPDDIWRGVGLLRLTDFDATTCTASTTSATFAAWLSPVTGAETTSGTAALYGIICRNNPVNFVDPYGLVDWGLVGRGTVGVIANGAMAVGGAFLAETGVGAAVAVYGAYQTGASFGNIVNGCRDAPEGPTGPAQAITQGGMLAGGVDPNSRAWARGDIAAQTVDIVIPTILAGRIDTRLVTRPGGPAGSLLGTLQRVYIPPEQAYGLVRAGVLIDQGITIYDYARFGWDEFNYYNDNCK